MSEVLSWVVVFVLYQILSVWNLLSRGVSNTDHRLPKGVRRRQIHPILLLETNLSGLPDEIESLSESYLPRGSRNDHTEAS